MARIIPELSDDQLAQLRSRAEAAVYRSCRDILPEDVIVIFSLEWIRIGVHGRPRDGDTDFVVFDPSRGILCIEVKGGGVAFDPFTNKWWSIDRRGTRHSIKDPFQQAKTEKFALKEYLEERPEWTRLRVRPLYGHAALFPDLDSNDPLVGPGRPKEIIGIRPAVDDLSDWVNSVFRFWGAETGRPVGIGAAGMGVVERLFCRSVEIVPLLSTLLEEEEEERIRLTEEQTRLVRGLGRWNRAVVSGGAGTGKTLLALNKARDLAEEGRRTLLFCYNRPLANHLHHCAEDVDNLDVMSFHQLCDWLIRRANASTGRDLLQEAEASTPSGDRYDIHFPHALAMATEVIDQRYDCIIVDESQDFGEEYWLPIELLLANDTDDVLFLFFDHNQAVYKRVSTFPIQEEPFLLTRSCRNTKYIHEAAYRYYRGEETEPPTIRGTPVEILAAGSIGGQAKRLHSRVVDLMSKEKVRPDSIAVLVPSRNHESFYDLLRNRSLPRPARWAFEEYGVPSGVRVETMQRFKGLEAPIIILWGIDGMEPTSDQELLYITLSRAKSRLYLIGNKADCKRVLEARGLVQKSSNDRARSEVEA